MVCRSVGLLVRLSVCLSVCHTSEPGKNAAPIEMPFRWRTRLGPGDHLLGGRPDHPWEGAIFNGEGASHCKV